MIRELCPDDCARVVAGLLSRYAREKGGDPGELIDRFTESLKATIRHRQGNLDCIKSASRWSR